MPRKFTLNLKKGSEKQLRISEETEVNRNRRTLLKKYKIPYGTDDPKQLAAILEDQTFPRNQESVDDNDQFPLEFLCIDPQNESFTDEETEEEDETYQKLQPNETVCEWAARLAKNAHARKIAQNSFGRRMGVISSNKARKVHRIFETGDEERRRAREREKKRQRRSRETPEQTATRRAKQAERQRQKRQRETLEQTTARRLKQAEKQRQRRKSETPEEKACRNAVYAERARLRRSMHKKEETAEQKSARCQRQSEYNNAMQAASTPEEKETIISQRKRGFQQQHVNKAFQDNTEKRKAYLEKKRIRTKQYRERVRKENPAEWEAYLERCRNRNRKTPEEQLKAKNALAKLKKQMETPEEKEERKTRTKKRREIFLMKLTPEELIKRNEEHKERVRRNKEELRKKLTAEMDADRKAKYAAAARLKKKMETSAIILIDRLMASNDPAEILSKDAEMHSIVQFWYNYKSFDFSQEVDEWRKLAYSILNPKELQSPSELSAEIEAALIVNNNEILKQFLITNGTKIKQYFCWRVKKFNVFLKNKWQKLSDEEKNAQRLRKNAYFRERYNLKKQGIPLIRHKTGRPVGAVTKSKFSEVVPEIPPEFTATSCNKTQTTPLSQRQPRKPRNKSIAHLKTRRSFSRNTVLSSTADYNTSADFTSSSCTQDCDDEISCSGDGELGDDGHQEDCTLVNKPQHHKCPSEAFGSNIPLLNQSTNASLFDFNQSLLYQQNIFNNQLQFGGQSNVPYEADMQPLLGISSLNNTHHHHHYPTTFQQPQSWNQNFPISVNQSLQFLSNSQVAVVTESLSGRKNQWQSSIAPSNLISMNQWTTENTDTQNPELTSPEQHSISRLSRKQSPSKVSLKKVSKTVPTGSSSIKSKSQKGSTVDKDSKKNLSTTEIPVPNPIALELVSSMAEYRPKCPHCSMIFFCKETCDQHVKKLHSGLGQFVCKLCSRISNTRSRLAQHIWFGHYNNCEELSCPFCPPTMSKPFTRHRNLHKHILKFHPTESNTFIVGMSANIIHKKTKFRCTECPEIFDRFIKLNHHYQSCHGALKKYFCRYCGIMLRRLDHLKEHVVRFHPLEGEADDKNGTSSNYEPIELDENNDLHQCNICRSKFLVQECLEKHKFDSHAIENNKENKIYNCKACDKSYLKEAQRDRHFNNKCPMRHLKCYNCDDEFTNEDLLQEHIREKHPDIEPYLGRIPGGYRYFKCEFCRRSFYTLITLRLHFERSHKDAKISTIPIPSEKFSSKNKSPENQKNVYINEVVAADPISTKKPKLLLLNEKIEKSTHQNNTPTSLEPQTEKSVEAEQAEFIKKCGMCELSFPAQDWHMFHKNYNRVEKRSCPVCFLQFDKPLAKWNHMKRVHKIQKPPEEEESSSVIKEQCLICYTEFSLAQFHKFHVNGMRDLKKYECDECQKQFYDRYSVRKHKKSFHRPNNSKLTDNQNTERRVEELPKGFAPEIVNALAGTVTGVQTCKICLVNYKTEDFLKKHIAADHQGQKERLFCNICNKTFSSRESLQRHTKNFHGIGKQNFECPFCKKIFSRSEHARDHIKRMHKDKDAAGAVIKIVDTGPEAKQFKCSLCINSFSSEKSLKIHISNIHCIQYFDSFCDYCGKQIKPDGLTGHIRNVHPDHAPAYRTVAESNADRNYLKKYPLEDILPLIAELQEAESIDRRQKQKESKENRKIRQHVNNSKQRQKKSIRYCENEESDEIISSENENNGERDWLAFESDTSCDNDEESESGSLFNTSTNSKSISNKSSIVKVLPLKPLIIKPSRNKKGSLRNKWNPIKSRANSITVAESPSPASKEDQMLDFTKLRLDEKSLSPFVLVERCGQADRLLQSFHNNSSGEMMRCGSKPFLKKKPKLDTNRSLNKLRNRKMMLSSLPNSCESDSGDDFSKNSFEISSNKTDSDEEKCTKQRKSKLSKKPSNPNRKQKKGTSSSSKKIKNHLLKRNEEKNKKVKGGRRSVRSAVLKAKYTFSDSSESEENLPKHFSKYHHDNNNKQKMSTKKQKSKNTTASSSVKQGVHNVENIVGLTEENTMNQEPVLINFPVDYQVENIPSVHLNYDETSEETSLIMPKVEIKEEDLMDMEILPEILWEVDPFLID